MTEFEDPVITIVRLLQKNMRVVEDDGPLASIHISREWYNRELLKNYDGQVTVGLAHSEDRKLSIAGKLRRRECFLNVNAWTMDLTRRQRMREEINRVIRENRNKPYETQYDFVGVGPPTATQKAYHAGSATELAPKDAGWTELTSDEYQKIWYSDDDRYSKIHTVNNEYALMIIRFKIASREQTVKKIVLRVEGYGTAPGGNGVTVKAWNFETSAWEQAQAGTGGADEWISITLTSSITDFIDSNGYVYLLARTTDPSDGTTAAVIYCDYADCIVTVNGITYVDVASYRDADKVDVKPFIFRTEFVLKSWVFETIPF